MGSSAERCQASINKACVLVVCGLATGHKQLAVLPANRHGLHVSRQANLLIAGQFPEISGGAQVTPSCAAACVTFKPKTGKILLSTFHLDAAIMHFGSCRTPPVIMGVDEHGIFAIYPRSSTNSRSLRPHTGTFVSVVLTRL